MEIGRIFGLPAHPLFVHAVVVLVPLCAIGVVLCAFWPAARRRLSLTVLVLSVFTAAMVPIVQASGEWFEDQVGRSALLERHTQLGDDFLPYAIALVIGAGAVAALRFMEGRSEGKRDANGGGFEDVKARQAPRWMVIGVVIVALLTSTAAGYQIFEIGDSGSAAAWAEFSTR
jgi:NADH:ubiquinone oxidoreductase subunit 5 (subunit L)/multisubunit Na+/H+ antiporter MnhA subunit